MRLEQQSREFDTLSIYERVLDTGHRTINIDNIATITIEIRKRWWLRMTALVIAIASAAWAGLALLSGVYAWLKGTSYSARHGYSSPLFTSDVFWYGALALIAFVSYRTLRDVTYLQIGAADGSRTLFRTKDLGYLEEVKDFLTSKINERNITATASFNFGDTILGGKIVGDVVGGHKVAGDLTFGDTATVTVTDNSQYVGDGQQVIRDSAGAVSSGRTMIANHSAAIAFGDDSTASYTAVDYSRYLQPVEDLRQHYASQPNGAGIEAQLAEIKALMETGTPSREERSTLHRLALDFSQFVQGYPPLVQLFTNIAGLAAA